MRVLLAYPGPWQAYVGAYGGSSAQLLLQQSELPTYKQIEDALRAKPDASINKAPLQRIQEEFQ